MTLKTNGGQPIYECDNPDQHAGIPNDTYFKDNYLGIILYKNTSGTIVNPWSASDPIKSTILFSDFKPNAGLVGTIDFSQFPAGSVPTIIKIKPKIAFASTDSSMSASVVIKDANGTSLNSAANLLVVGDTTGVYGPVVSASAILSQSSESTISAELTLTTGGGSATIRVVNTGGPSGQQYWGSSQGPNSWGDNPNIKKSTDAAITATITASVDMGAYYLVTLSNVVGAWSVVTAVSAANNQAGATGSASNYVPPSAAGTINDLTAGSFDVWIWSVLGI